jgi:hypothetical protein
MGGSLSECDTFSLKSLFDESLCHRRAGSFSDWDNLGSPFVDDFDELGTCSTMNMPTMVGPGKHQRDRLKE